MTSQEHRTVLLQQSQARAPFPRSHSTNAPRSNSSFTSPPPTKQQKQNMKKDGISDAVESTLSSNEHELNSESRALLARIYAKYENASDVLDEIVHRSSAATTAAITTNSSKQQNERMKQEAERPPSPGLSPIHISTLHTMRSPISAQHDDELCEHSIHSIRTTTTGTETHNQPTTRSNTRSHKSEKKELHFKSDIQEKPLHSILKTHPHSTPRSPLTFAEAANVEFTTQVRTTTSASSSSTSAATHLQVPQPTKPADLYQHANERMNFFSIIQELWNQQMKVYEKQHQDKASENHRRNNVHGHGAGSRSTMTTLTSTPNSTVSNVSRVSSAMSTPPSQQQEGDRVIEDPDSDDNDEIESEGQQKRAFSMPAPPSSMDGNANPIALWESQIMSWENRLCAWKNAQEATLVSRAKELETARFNMEKEMKEQEAVYALRQSKYAAAVSKLDREKKEWKACVLENSTRETELEQLMAQRQRELEKREARLAKARKEYSETLMAAAGQQQHRAATAMSEQVLHALTSQLNEAYESKEQQLGQLYAEKNARLSRELLLVKSKQNQLKQAQSEFELQREQFENEKAQWAARVAVEMKEKQLTQREQLEATIESQVVHRFQSKRLDLEHDFQEQLQKMENKWQARAQEWFLQRESLQAQIEALREAELNNNTILDNHHSGHHSTSTSFTNNVSGYKHQHTSNASAMAHSILAEAEMEDRTHAREQAVHSLQAKLDDMHSKLLAVEDNFHTKKREYAQHTSEQQNLIQDLKFQNSNLKQQLQSARQQSNHNDNYTNSKRTSSSTVFNANLSSFTSNASHQLEHLSVQTRKQIVSQFENEIHQLRSQFETELSETNHTHALQIQEYESTLLQFRSQTEKDFIKNNKEQQDRVLALQAQLDTLKLSEATLSETVRDHVDKIQQLQQQLRENGLQLAKVQQERDTLLAAKEHMSDMSTSTDDLVAAHLEANTRELQTKTELVQALQVELSKTHQAFEGERQGFLLQKEEVQRSAAKKLEDLSSTHREELSTLEQHLVAKQNVLVEAYEEQLKSLKALLTSKDSELQSAFSSHNERIQTILHREEVVAHQIQLIENQRKEKLDAISQKEQDVSSQVKSFEQAQEAWNQKKEQHTRELAEEMERMALKQSEAEQALSERENTLKANWQQLEEARKNVKEAQEKLAAEQLAAAEASAILDRKQNEFKEDYGDSYRRLNEGQVRLDSALKQLRIEQATLKDDRATYKSDQATLESLQKEVAEWKIHVETRDAELSEAIAKFESHMSSRESAAHEWEERLRIVEEKYSIEFGKITDETTRLQLWEEELLLLQKSLHAREKHLVMVEKNLSDYLQPFNDSNASAMLDSTSALFTPLKNQGGGNSHLTEEQRTRLQMLTTPIMQRHKMQANTVQPSQQLPHTQQLISPQLMPAMSSSQRQLSKVNSTSPTIAPVPVSAAPEPAKNMVTSHIERSSAPSVMSTPISAASKLIVRPSPSTDLIYSPTQAELSLLTDDKEISFTIATEP